MEGLGSILYKNDLTWAGDISKSGQDSPCELWVVIAMLTPGRSTLTRVDINPRLPIPCSLRLTVQLATLSWDEQEKGCFLKHFPPSYPPFILHSLLRITSRSATLCVPDLSQRIISEFSSSRVLRFPAGRLLSPSRFPLMSVSFSVR